MARYWLTILEGPQKGTEIDLVKKVQKLIW
jgi:hypothetical protein